MELMYVIWRKLIRKYGGKSPRSHCNLLQDINSCDTIDNIRGKRCLKFIWNLINSDTILLNRTVIPSLSMSSTSRIKTVYILCSNIYIYI